MLAGTGGMSWTTRLALGATTSLGAFAGVVGSGAHAMHRTAARHAGAASRAGRIGNGDIGNEKGHRLDGGALIVVRRRATLRASASALVRRARAWSAEYRRSPTHGCRRPA